MAKRVVIIGGGPGGDAAALVLAEKGADVTIVEKENLGGTCLNRGCIPTKILLHAAHLLREISTGEKFGILSRGVDLDFGQLRMYKDQLIESLSSGMERLYKARKIQVIKGTGLFETPRKIRLRETGEVAEGDAIIIATGSVPATVPIEGIDGAGVFNSDHALSIEKIPRSIAIIGGGYIGLEFAQIFRALGSEVTVLELLDQVVPSEDVDIATALAAALKSEGIKIYTGASVKEISGRAERKVVRYSIQGQNHSIEATGVLMAVGRRSNIEGLELEKVGVKTEEGRIVVNNQMETTAAGIYAIGDAIGGPMLAHVASAEGHLVADNIGGNCKQAMDYTAVPRCIYTYPEAASVGLTESQAREVYGEVLIGRAPIETMAKARILGLGGFVKLISEKKYGKILGVHLIGPQVIELIAEGGLAINLECTVEEMAYTMHPHPTLSEVLMKAAMNLQECNVQKP